MEKKQSHLEMIQGVVNRLSHNSFLLKGWSVILISAFFALAANNTKVFFIYLAYFPAIAFWILDGYFLHQERLFRELYDYVRGLEEDKIDFSMNTKVVKDKVESWRRIVFSITLLIFHGTVFGAILIVMLIVNYITRGGT
jgi:hypothetical protein